MTDDERDVEEMMAKWDDLDDLTITGLHVLRDIVEKTIQGRIDDGEDYTVRVPLPPDPLCKLCWSCRTWIDTGEVCVLIEATGKTYHKLCKP